MDRHPIVRPATTADLTGIGQVARRTRRATYAGLIPDPDIERFLVGAYSTEHLAATLSRFGPGVIVAVDAADVVGYAICGANRDGVGELFALYVLPEWQGHGVGHRLWQAAATHLHASGFTEMRVWVLAGNDQARRFYERQGAWPVAERGFLVGGGPVAEVGYAARLTATHLIET